jgi:hypothetical protein
MNFRKTKNMVQIKTEENNPIRFDLFPRKDKYVLHLHDDSCMTHVYIEHFTVEDLTILRNMIIRTLERRKAREEGREPAPSFR